LCHSLDEVLEVYLSLHNRRNNATTSSSSSSNSSSSKGHANSKLIEEGDIPRLLIQLVANMRDGADDNAVLQKCFRVLEVVVMEFAGYFVPHFDVIAKHARVC
jgi:hypothetical protein